MQKSDRLNIEKIIYDKKDNFLLGSMSQRNTINAHVF